MSSIKVDLEFVRAQIELHLPTHVRWLIKGTPLDFDFSRARAPLQPLDVVDLNCDYVLEEWKVLFLFGEQDYAEGGGASPWLGVHRDSGEIHGLDVERDDESVIFFLNSNIETFIRTFRLFDKAIHLGQVDLDMLLAKAKEIDPRGFRKSEWKDLLEYLNSEE
jgi:hypothetical protein